MHLCGCAKHGFGSAVTCNPFNPGLATHTGAWYLRFKMEYHLVGRVRRFLLQVGGEVLFARASHMIVSNLSPKA